MQTFNFYYQNKLTLADYATKESLVTAINNWWSEEYLDHINSAPVNGQEYIGEGEISSINDDGEETSRDSVFFSAEHYHGDYAEHNTHWGM